MHEMHKQAWWVSLGLLLLLLGLNLFGGITQIVCVVLAAAILLGVLRKLGRMGTGGRQSPGA